MCSSEQNKTRCSKSIKWVFLRYSRGNSDHNTAWDCQVCSQPSIHMNSKADQGVGLKPSWAADDSTERLKDKVWGIHADLRGGRCGARKRAVCSQSLVRLCLSFLFHSCHFRPSSPHMGNCHCGLWISYSLSGKKKKKQSQRLNRDLQHTMIWPAVIIWPHLHFPALAPPLLSILTSSCLSFALAVPFA